MACAKQLVVFLLLNINNKIISIGTNHCDNPQISCPRKFLNSGNGYDICKNVCGQKYHAEIDCINNIPSNHIPIYGILIGHTYCCEKCLNALNNIGIYNIIIIKEVFVE